MIIRSAVGKVFMLTAMLASATTQSYLNRDEAIAETRNIICNLFARSTQDAATKEKIDLFINDFTRSTFQYDVSYSQFNHLNVAQMVLESAAEWIRNNAMKVAVQEIMTFYRLHHTISYKEQEQIKVIVGNAIKIQVERDTKKIKTAIEDALARAQLGMLIAPMYVLYQGALAGFVGNSLRNKVREQIRNILSRDCAVPSCGNDAEKKVLLDCGHKLHTSCLTHWKLSQESQGIKLTCPLCRAEIKLDDAARPAEPRPTPPAPSQSVGFWSWLLRW